MLDEYGRPMCDRCGCFVPVNKLKLPSGKVLGPEHAARILCKDCSDYMENPPTGLEKPGLYRDEWDTEAFGKNMRNAIEEFCASHWDKPRKYHQLEQYDRGGMTFRLRDGRRTYWCRLVDNAPLVYRISVVDCPILAAREDGGKIKGKGSEDAFRGE